jgi:hypothetical protein
VVEAVKTIRSLPAEAHAAGSSSAAIAQEWK